MNSLLELHLELTISEKEAIQQRAQENGFDSLSTYIKLVALRASQYNVPSSFKTQIQTDVSITLLVTPKEEESILQKAKDCECEDIPTYLKFMALNAIITVGVEIRSTGNLDAMLERIANKKKK